MQAQLIKLPKPLLQKIANDISIEYSTQKETAKKVASYYRDYGCKWADLVARYHIENDTMHN